MSDAQIREMHEGQFNVETSTVQKLISSQMPQWRDLPVRRVPSGGTVNSLFRVGDDALARFSFFPSADANWQSGSLQLEKTLATLRPRINCAIPQLLAIGEPDDGYPGYWTLHQWIDGDVASSKSEGVSEHFAVELAEFVAVLHSMPTEDLTRNPRSRGGPLAEREAQVRACLAKCDGHVDVRTLGRIWTSCSNAARGPHEDCWIHHDLMPGNLLVKSSRLVAVIDWEGPNVGDPAVDLMPAWNLLDTSVRLRFRDTLGVDDDTWDRGRAWALCQAIVALPYYVETNPFMADVARHTLEALVDDALATG